MIGEYDILIVHFILCYVYGVPSPISLMMVSVSIGEIAAEP